MKIVIYLNLVLLLGCSSIYYNLWETFGKEKRDLLRSNVIAANEEQGEVQKQFKDTLTRIKKEYKFNAGELEKTYEKLNSDYEIAAVKSKNLTERIEKVIEIGDDLFEEWEDEAKNIKDYDYRKDSLKKRKSTMKRFNKMVKAMQEVEGQLKVVLEKFQDQVLYLKHNLNARAIGAFKTEFKSIEKGISELMSEIEKSSHQADKFINEMQS